MLRDLLRRGEEGSERGAGERAADADATDTERGKLLDSGEVRVDDDVHRLGRDGAHDRLDVGRGPDPGSEQAVGARVGVGSQAANRLADVGAAGDEAL